MKPRNHGEAGLRAKVPFLLLRSNPLQILARCGKISALKAERPSTRAWLAEQNYAITFSVRCIRAGCTSAAEAGTLISFI